jgi:tetratricopeptide (TPR) repeat protein
MGPALRVFISYTSELAEQPSDWTWVAAAEKAITFRGHAEVQMNHFVSQGRPPEETCRAELAQCQVWVGILGFRYGTLVPGTERSYTEMEFDAAGEQKLHRIAVLLQDGVPVGRRADAAVNKDRQLAFRRRVRGSLTARPLATPAELFAAVFKEIERLEHLRPDARWLNEPPHVVPVVLRDRQPERQELRAVVQERQDRVVALVGDNGVGKTAMAAELLRELQADRSEQGFGVLDYLSASGSLSVSGAGLLERLIRAIHSPARRERLDQVRTADEASWYEQVEDVLDALDEDVLVVLDQAEDLLDEQGFFHDWMLGQLVSELARRDDHRVSLLLVTARQPSRRILGHRRSAVFDLPRMLRTDDDARLLLADLTKPPPTALVQDPSRIIQLAGRHPRSLELLVAALRLDPDLPIEHLDELEGLDEGRRVSRLVEHLEQTMPGEMLAVVRVLAVLGLPMGAMDVAAVLPPDEEPGLFTRSAVTELLARLAAIRIVRESDGKYSLPMEEARVLIDLWCWDDAGRASHRMLLRRAADHLAMWRLLNPPTAIEHLGPHFREIALRLQLGESATCVELMADLDREYLRKWGYRHVLIPWRRRLMGWQEGEHYWRANVSAMVHGAVELDQLDEAARLLDKLYATLPTGPSALASAEVAQLERDRLAIVGQLGYIAFLDGRLHDAEGWYGEQLRLAARPYETCTANLGLGLCLLDRGRIDDAATHLEVAWAVVADAGGEAEVSAARPGVLIARAQLARILGDNSTPEFVEESLRAAALANDVRMKVRCLDLQAALLLDRSLDKEEGDAFVADAVTVAAKAAEIAARSGGTDVTRTAHATLAIAHLRRGAAGLDAARSAATSAARFFGSKRGLIGHVVLGIVHLRDRRRPGAENRARDAFYEAITLAESFRADQGRPYWVWDTIGLAQAGLHLCRVDGAHEKSLLAYRHARELIRAPGAVRRAEVLLDTLAADMAVDAVRDIRRAVRGDEADARGAGATGPTAPTAAPPASTSEGRRVDGRLGTVQ